MYSLCQHAVYNLSTPGRRTCLHWWATLTTIPVPRLSVSGFSSAVVAALLLQYLQLVPNTVQPTNIFRLMQRIVQHSSY
jgi:hypothetical protein